MPAGMTYLDTVGPTTPINSMPPTHRSRGRHVRAAQLALARRASAPIAISKLFSFGPPAWSMRVPLLGPAIQCGLGLRGWSVHCRHCDPRRASRLLRITAAVLFVCGFILKNLASPPEFWQLPIRFVRWRGRLRKRNGTEPHSRALRQTGNDNPSRRGRSALDHSGPGLQQTSGENLLRLRLPGYSEVG
jgi:hypothetical protein